MSEKKDRFQISELFMAKADWNRTFIGSIERFTQEDGSTFVVGRIPVNNCTILASASNNDELGAKLDIIVKMLLAEGLHAIAGKTVDIAGTPFFLN